MTLCPDSIVRVKLFVVFHFQNYKCFGIQFYDEFWSGGEDACNNYDIHGTADNCLCSGSDYKPFHESPEDCVGPVGGEFSNFVYEIIKVSSDIFL